MSFVVCLIMLYNDDPSLFVTHKIKRLRLTTLFRLELVGFTSQVKINKQIEYIASWVS